MKSHLEEYESGLPHGQLRGHRQFPFLEMQSLILNKCKVLMQGFEPGTYVRRQQPGKQAMEHLMDSQTSRLTSMERVMRQYEASRPS